jgi:SpoVK/Ycf46/Vps4 family AAA+-type ATPase
VPTTRKLVDLFRAIAAEDLRGAAAISAQICKGEESSGHRTAARLLRGALYSKNNSAPLSVAAPSESAQILSAALVRLPETKLLSDVTLAPIVMQELASVILEWKHRARLEKRGLHPRSKLLFHGPPGCGKSLTAQAIGRELGLPVYMVRFDAVIGAYLGQTAMHLRQLFHFAETTACVLLLDELDALGKRRGNPLDVGELDRIVISLMQELEHSRPKGVIIGTSNLPRHLDDALWRRFDLDVGFARPSRATLRRFLRHVAKQMRVTLNASVTARVLRAKSFADAERIIIGEVRRQALANVRGA